MKYVRGTSVSMHCCSDDSYLCLTVDPPPDRGLTDLDDGLRPAPTDVELAGAG
jgi:hypothetical protein